jgi:hypothetical protein
MLGVQSGQGFDVDVFVVDEDEVGAQNIFPFMTMSVSGGVRVWLETVMA